MASYYSEHQQYYVSVDCIIFGFDKEKLRILIGRRQMDPGRGQWSLYGGFVEAEESVDEAAKRVLEKLTGMKGVYMKQVGAFGDIDRDPGGRVVSVAYYALISVDDYAASLMERYGTRWVGIDDMPALYSDHREMVKKALKMLRMTFRTIPAGFNLLPTFFTLSQLQKLFEAVMGKELDKRNFRKRVKDVPSIEKTDKIDKKGSKRGARLYFFDRDKYNEDQYFKL